MLYDAIVVGGSYAGLSAAMQLARARRKVLVIDAGQRRNRNASHAHGFLTQDGTPPGEIAGKGREQLLAYDTVRWLDAKATAVDRTASGFRIHIEKGEVQQAARLVLATGVVDVLPDLPGLAERWGRRVFHCPYCHGYELDRGEIGILATSPMTMHLAMLLPDWGPTSLFLNDTFEPDAGQLDQLQARGVRIERAAVQRIEGELDLVLADGRVKRLDGLFVASQARVANPLVAQLGCTIEAGPLGEFIVTDAMKQTSVTGVFACGDVARQPHSLAFAVADGAMAGAATHRSLVFPDA